MLKNDLFLQKQQKPPVSEGSAHKLPASGCDVHLSLAAAPLLKFWLRSWRLDLVEVLRWCIFYSSLRRLVGPIWMRIWRKVTLGANPVTFHSVQSKQELLLLNQLTAKWQRIIVTRGIILRTCSNIELGWQSMLCALWVVLKFSYRVNQHEKQQRSIKF